ncbi:MAG: PaaI family thioesterase [Minwuia sp.]|nr:PaaI family thioesterase [Minwuia sp.]
MDHPYGRLIGFRITAQGQGTSTLELDARDDLMNPHGVVHGAALYALADTGMGAALYGSLVKGESCATINCAISYFRGVTTGTITCTTRVTNKGRSVATLQSEIWNDGKLVATANGQFSIFARR